MAASYEIHEEPGVVVLTTSGDVSDEEWIEVVAQLRADPRLDRSFGLLIDVRDQVGGGVSSDGVRSLAKVPSLVSATSPKAVLLSTDFGYGMTRMFNLTVGEDEHAVQIFRDEGEARRHVGLDPA